MHPRPNGSRTDNSPRPSFPLLLEFWPTQSHGEGGGWVRPRHHSGGADESRAQCPLASRPSMTIKFTKERSMAVTRAEAEQFRDARFAKNASLVKLDQNEKKCVRSLLQLVPA